MLELLRSQSRSASDAVKYVTTGVLMMIWAGLWYYYFLRPVPDAATWHRYLCVGTILSGFSIVIIGMLFGFIGRGARGADNTVGVATSTPAATVAPAQVATTTPAIATSAPVVASSTPVVTTLPGVAPARTAAARQ